VHTEFNIELILIQVTLNDENGIEWIYLFGCSKRSPTQEEHVLHKSLRHLTSYNMLLQLTKKKPTT